MAIQIRYTKLSFEDVYAILQKGDADFYIPLSYVMDIDKYARKLSEFAHFLLLEENCQVYGCIAYYLNEEGRFIYISHYWIDSNLQHQGHGGWMLRELRSLYENRYKEIRLEVGKKNPALYFYLKEGFSTMEDHFEKVLLSLPLNP